MSEHRRVCSCDCKGSPRLLQVAFLVQQSRQTRGSRSIATLQKLNQGHSTRMASPSDDWSSQRIVPSDEQRLVLQDVMDRCFEERVDEEDDLEIRSEPLRLFLHGVPGAGKSKLLEWIRMFFEEALGL